MHKYYNIHFRIQSTNTPTCFDVLHIILREVYIKQAYIKHKLISKQIKNFLSLETVDVRVLENELEN